MSPERDYGCAGQVGASRDTLFPEDTFRAIIEKARALNRDTRDAGLMKLAM